MKYVKGVFFKKKNNQTLLILIRRTARVAQNPTELNSVSVKNKNIDKTPN